MILQRLTHDLGRRLGVDRAVAFTFVARAVQMLGSTGTVLLIVHFLSPIEQGYYYTLLSLVALQVIFEVGFAVVVLQMAAHESAHLSFQRDGTVEGDPIAYARLASVLQQATKWYLAAGTLMLLILTPVGMYFFYHHSQAGAPVSWQAPWIVTLAICVVNFIQNPIFSFLEGCGQVPAVAHTRMWQSLAGTILAWSAMLLHHGLFSPAMVLAGNAIVGFAFFWTRRSFLLPLFWFTAGQDSVRWGKEVWPFQWRIAISWMGTYFTAQIFMPILFAYRGPVEAGQMGMSISITGYLGALVLSWMHTKAAPFGQLVVRREFSKLDDLFFRTLKQSVVILSTAVAVFLAGVVVLGHVYPKLANRVVSPPVFMLLCLTGISNYIVQSEAIYLRSFKREPFLFQSTIVAALTIGTTLAVAGRWGVESVAVGYFVCSGVIGLAIATNIFLRWRARRVRQASLMAQYSVPLP